jgi:hypothetical protein
MEFHRKWQSEGVEWCEYTATLWEGPLRSGDKGRSITTRCADRVVVQRLKKDDGSVLVRRSMANTSPSVSYYGQLSKRMGLHDWKRGGE